MECQTYIYKTCSDGTEISADVYLKPSEANSSTASQVSRPIALLIHGGGWTVGSRSEVPKLQIQLLLHLNFIPVSVDYRLCPTIGLYDGPIADTQDALTWCQDELPTLLQRHTGNPSAAIADGSKVVAVGWSSGGHLALMLSQAPNPPLAILDFYGTTALSSDFWHLPSSASLLSVVPPGVDLSTIASQLHQQNSPSNTPTSFPSHPIDFTNPRTAWTLESMRSGTKTMACIGDGNLDRVDPRTWYSNPRPDLICEGGKKFPPLMVLHGDRDDLAPLALSVEMVECVRRQGVVAEIEILEGLGHGFDRFVEDGKEGATRQRVGASVRRGYEFLKRFV